MPLKGLEKTPILHQNVVPPDDTPLSDDHISVHFHPFRTLPLLESHVHPKFAIINAGEKLRNSSPDDIQKLIHNFPEISAGLTKVVTLYNAWTAKLEHREQEDPSFQKSDDDDDGDGDSDNGSGGDDDDQHSDYVDPSTRSHATKREKARKGPVVRRPPSRRGVKRKALTEETLSNHGQLLGEDSWTEVRIREWSNHNGLLGKDAWTDEDRMREWSKPLEKRRRLMRCGLNLSLPLSSPHSCLSQVV